MGRWVTCRLVAWLVDHLSVRRWSVGRWRNCRWVGGRLLAVGDLSVVGGFVIRYLLLDFGIDINYKQKIKFEGLQESIYYSTSLNHLHLSFFTFYILNGIYLFFERNHMTLVFVSQMIQFTKEN